MNETNWSNMVVSGNNVEGILVSSLWNLTKDYTDFLTKPQRSCDVKEMYGKNASPLLGDINWTKTLVWRLRGYFLLALCCSGGTCPNCSLSQRVHCQTIIICIVTKIYRLQDDYILSHCIKLLLFRNTDIQAKTCFNLWGLAWIPHLMNVLIWSHARVKNRKGKDKCWWVY